MKFLCSLHTKSSYFAEFRVNSWVFPNAVRTLVVNQSPRFANGLSQFWGNWDRKLWLSFYGNGIEKIPKVLSKSSKWFRKFCVFPNISPETYDGLRMSSQISPTFVENYQTTDDFRETFKFAQNSLTFHRKIRLVFIKVRWIFKKPSNCYTILRKYWRKL